MPPIVFFNNWGLFFLIGVAIYIPSQYSLYIFCIFSQDNLRLQLISSQTCLPNSFRFLGFCLYEIYCPYRLDIIKMAGSQTGRSGRQHRKDKRSGHNFRQLIRGHKQADLNNLFSYFQIRLKLFSYFEQLLQVYEIFSVPGK